VCIGGSCEISDGGRATYFNYSVGGACSLGEADPGEYIVAVAEPEWAGSAMCGRCIEVTGPLATITAKVYDLCPAATNPEWCDFGGHLDLGAEAFAAIADPGLGIIPVTWRTVACDEPGNAKLINMDGINQWWYAVIADDHRHGVASVEVQDFDGPWVDATRQNYNVWVVQDGNGLDLPLSVRMKDIFGNVIESTDIVTDFGDGSEFDFGDQFPECADVVFADDFESGDATAWSNTFP
jgi:expansin (peptidoglycan-binding protein)